MWSCLWPSPTYTYRRIAVGDEPGAVVLVRIPGRDRLVDRRGLRGQAKPLMPSRLLELAWVMGGSTEI